MRANEKVVERRKREDRKNGRERGVMKERDSERERERGRSSIADKLGGLLSKNIV